MLNHITVKKIEDYKDKPIFCMCAKNFFSSTLRLLWINVDINIQVYPPSHYAYIYNAIVFFITK